MTELWTIDLLIIDDFVLEPNPDPMIRYPDGHQVSPRIAFDGFNYLTIWIDLTTAQVSVMRFVTCTLWPLVPALYQIPPFS